MSDSPYWLKSCPWCRTCGFDPCVCGPVMNDRGKQAERHLVDGTMINALQNVCFGSFNAKADFVSAVKANGVQTPRQRWWLVKLVVMHKKQVTSDLAIAMAEAWLATHPEPK